MHHPPPNSRLRLAGFTLLATTLASSCGEEPGTDGSFVGTPSATPTTTAGPADTLAPVGSVPGVVPPPAGTDPNVPPPVGTDGLPAGTTGPMGSGTTAPTGSGTAPTDVTATPDTPAPDVDDPTTTCTEKVPIGQRLIRLNYTQLATTYASLLGPEAIAGVSLDDPRQREFQPLFSVEGTTINTQVLQRTLDIARTASDVLLTRFAEVTGCALPAAEACVQTYLSGLATSAFRRPITPEEQTSIEQMYAEATAAGLSIEDATRYSVQGILLSPATLYRTEFGVATGDPAVVTLDPYEMASALSYFLLDGPPDDGLLAAASSGALATPAGVQTEVDRLLATEAVRTNLVLVMMAYLRMGDIDEVVKSATVFPESVFSVGLRNAMYRETELFLTDRLWQGTVSDLLTSRDTFVNAPLAAHYGVAYPAAAGGDPEQDFVAVTLPEGQRSGLLTQASIMTMRSVPDTTSVVGRGLFVNSAFLCLQRPPAPPTDVATTEAIEEQLQDATQTEREKSDHRAETVPCNGCHSLIDPYGLVLENYDAIGRYQTTYGNGTAIDTSTTTPPSLTQAATGRVAMVPATLANVGELIALMDESDLFAHCMAANLMKYAVAAPLVDPKECAVSDVDAAFAAGEPTFGNLVRQVALSSVVSQRSVGVSTEVTTEDATENTVEAVQ